MSIWVPFGGAPLTLVRNISRRDTGVVVECVVHGAAVVPDGQGVPGPAQTAGEVLVGGVAVEVAQQVLGLDRGPALEPGRVDGVHVESRPTGHRVDDDGGVDLLGVGVGRGGDGHGGQVLDLVEEAAGPVGHAGRVHGPEAVEGLAQPRESVS